MNGGLVSSSCPSCGSFLEEENKGRIEYSRDNKERIIFTVPFCLECLDKPDKINIPEIIKNLTEKGYWKAPEIKLLRKALRNFKKGKTKRSRDPDGTITYYSKKEKEKKKSKINEFLEQEDEEIDNDFLEKPGYSDKDFLRPFG